jgi:hypothetical protein
LDQRIIGDIFQTTEKPFPIRQPQPLTGNLRDSPLQRCFGLVVCSAVYFIPHREATSQPTLLAAPCFGWKIPVDLLCVVHAENVRHPHEFYRFFKEIKAQYISFIPLVEPQPASQGGVSSRTVLVEAFGVFLCAVFDKWV